MAWSSPPRIGGKLELSRIGGVGFGRTGNTAGAINLTVDVVAAIPRVDEKVDRRKKGGRKTNNRTGKNPKGEFVPEKLLDATFQPAPPTVNPVGGWVARFRKENGYVSMSSRLRNNIRPETRFQANLFAGNLAQMPDAEPMGWNVSSECTNSANKTDCFGQFAHRWRGLEASVEHRCSIPERSTDLSNRCAKLTSMKPQTSVKMFPRQ